MGFQRGLQVNNCLYNDRVVNDSNNIILDQYSRTNHNSEGTNKHFLRRLRIHGVANNILMLFYRANLESIIRYGITTWFGNLSVKLKSQLQNLIKRAGKIMGMQPPCSLQAIFERTLVMQGSKITRDPNHILHSQFELMPSGRRYRVPTCRLNRYKFSFVPLAIKALNNR